MNNDYPYICVEKCPELEIDDSTHCRCMNPDIAGECPCGNVPKWELTKEKT